MQIPEILADLRAAGLTQNDIAARSGIAQSTVSQLCTGARGKRPSFDTVTALMRLWTEVCAAERCSRIVADPDPGRVVT